MVGHNAVRQDSERDSSLCLGDDFQEREIVGGGFKQTVATDGTVKYMKNEPGCTGPGAVRHIEA